MLEESMARYDVIEKEILEARQAQRVLNECASSNDALSLSSSSSEVGCFLKRGRNAMGIGEHNAEEDEKEDGWKKGKVVYRFRFHGIFNYMLK